MFTMRFDMRAPSEGAPIGELYAAALEMSAWAEDKGCVAVQVSEHHASPDGYNPAPIVLAAGIAARTKARHRRRRRACGRVSRPLGRIVAGERRTRRTLGRHRRSYATSIVAGHRTTGRV